MKKAAMAIAAVLIGGFAFMLYAEQTGKGLEPKMTAERAAYKKAVFAGGCFWCLTPPFRKLEGVRDVVAGYTGGNKENPAYEEVASGSTGHLEAVEITYDSSKVSYEVLLNVFWRNIDPTDAGGQFLDRGSQYHSAIYYQDDEQKKAAEKSRYELDRSGRFSKPIVTAILPADAFYPAEAYHQDYDLKNPVRYKLYKSGSGREGFLERVWKGEENLSGSERARSSYIKPTDDELKKKLSDLQYKVTQQCSTEPAFNNQYWDNKKDGIYVDVVTGEPLFSSLDKYDSGTGWPSFKQALEPENLIEKDDVSMFMTRTEVKSRHGDSHLGHVFDDGPAPTGKRYCMNSASLRFIPKEELAKEGYGKYLKLFK